MSIQTIMLIMVSLGFILGVLACQLVHYAGEYVDRIHRERTAAKRLHPAGGRGNLHVGTIHVPRSRQPRDEVFDQEASDELPPGWSLPVHREVDW